MYKSFFVVLILLCGVSLFAGNVTKEYRFNQPTISNTGAYQQVSIEGCITTATPGCPALPYQPVALALPAGHEATDIQITLLQPIELPGTYRLAPYQYVRPLSDQTPRVFIKNEQIYQANAFYPSEANGKLSTGFLNGYSIALSAFTPVVYNPVSGKVVYYAKAIVEVTSQATAKGSQALANQIPVEANRYKVMELVNNPEEVKPAYSKSFLSNPYKYLILTPQSFVEQFQPLKALYDQIGLPTVITSLQDVYASSTGVDNQEKIRNYIRSEYQNSGIEYVLLGGDDDQFPYRGFFCEVQSSSLYSDNNIPSDLYYSALDGTWNDNENGLWGEVGEDDLLPDVAVARLPFSNATDLARMLNKTIKYQTAPVPGEFERPLMVDEKLYDNPETWGADYLDLLIGLKDENGYVTNGIPEAQNIDYLYERETGYWGPSELFARINDGRQFVHHSGHSNWDYAMRLGLWDVTDANFYAVDGVQHNYTLVYTHGCICGAFDYSDCIAEEMLKINNFCVAGAFNSRYGWFNEGQTEGPSAHMHREFVNALYTDGYNRIAATHQQSKIKTAPFVNAPGQWEPGALRWCFYDCNILGDAAMKIWTDNLTGIDKPLVNNAIVTVSPNPASTMLTIKMATGYVAEGFVLYNAAAQVVIENEVHRSGMFQIDVSLLPTGMYILEINANGSMSHSKILIQ